MHPPEGRGWYFAPVTRYELLERIGAGRVAEIFRGKAVAAGGFEKPVAIKRILPHLSQDRRFVELLIAEAKVLSALRHRNIVQIFDVGVGDDGQHFLVMEFVEGVNLDAMQRSLEARRQRLPVDLVLHLGAEICEALDHVQAAPAPDGRPMRLVHRDVTPGNVLVSRAGEIKLTDFGLAKRPEEGTASGSLRGRYGYVSPEQAAGQPVDGRSDVFAVGLIMWELATGRRLFSAMQDFDALRAVREDDIPAVRDQDPTLPAELDAILVEALAKDPRKRLPSAGELGKRLRGLRYSLDTSTGDPAAAFARLVPTVTPIAAAGPAAEVGAAAAAADADARAAARGKPGRRPKPTTGGFEVSTEPTFVRIRTADGFAHDPDGSGLLHARQLLDRFEEEETRLARLPAGMLDEDSTRDRERSRRDSGEVTVAGAPLHLDPSGDGPPLHLEDSDHGARDRRPRPAGKAGRGDSTKGRAMPPAPPPTPAKGSAGPQPGRPGPSSPPPSSKGAASPSPAKAGASSSSLPKAGASSSSLPKAGASSASPPPVGASSSSPPAAGRPPVAPVFGGAAAPGAQAGGARRDPSVGRAATPTSPQVFDLPEARPMSAPPVAGFAGGNRRWWPILVGAAIIAVLSFLITSAALEAPERATAPPLAPPIDAAAPDAAPTDAATPRPDAK